MTTTKKTAKKKTSVPKPPKAPAGRKKRRGGVRGRLLKLFTKRVTQAEEAGLLASGEADELREQVGSMSIFMILTIIGELLAMLLKYWESKN